MHVERQRLMILLNALYDQDVDSVPVEHPCDEIGELVRIELEDNGQASIRFTQGALTYQDSRKSIPAKYGEAAYDDLPDAQTYTRTMVASGHIELENSQAISEFVNRHGYADLEAGHDPVVVGLDANIMPWRLPEVLGIDSETGERDDRDRHPTNGYALATGVKEELDWHFKQYNTHGLTNAFGKEFDRLDNQPAGANREGLLGLYEYRRLRTNRTVDIVECETGDEAIVEGYRKFNEESRKKAILLSNDHGFVERSNTAGVPAQHIEYPVDLPRKVTASWTAACELLYYLSVLFGVVTLPKVTIYGVWNGKDGRHWQHEQLDVDCRSPKIEPQLKRDLRILNAAKN
jgi:rRNA-processing protein FCF1